MGSIITLPTDFLSGMTAYIGSVFGDLSSVIMLAIGLPLAFWFIGKTIGLIKTR